MATLTDSMGETIENIPKGLKYIQDAYIESFNFLTAWKRRKVRQLILLNNLQRGDETIASTLLLTLFNRTLSSMYDDKLQVKFLPSQGIEQNQLDAYNVLAQSDYMEMDKPRLDYDWIWDTLFFNRGYCETYHFNKRRKIMEPQIINPLVFGYDPNFEAVQDWRYYWKWLTKSKVEIERLIKNGDITGIKKPDEIMGGVDDLIWTYKLQRDLAKKALDQAPNNKIGNDIYQILEFYGYDQDEDSPSYGKKCCFWLDRGFSKILYKEELKYEDLDYGEGEKGSKWPIVVKEAFREPHASINFGIADLLEDKHRAKSVLLNLAYIAAKDKANPMYWYNDNVTDATQFLSRQIDQHIKLNDDKVGENSVGPINTQEPMTPELMQFISMLQDEANEPLGTGVASQPEQSKSRNTATQSAIDQQLNDMAQSLLSKVLQFGEQEFWSHWFHRYAKHADSLGEKMANIVGVKGIDSQLIDLKVFNTDFPPGVLVYSAKEAEYKELVLRRDLMQLYPNLQETLDQDGMRNFNKFVLFPKFLNDPSLVDIIFPKTLDELKATDENSQLIDDEHVEAQPTDAHETHIYIHNMIPPGKRTWAMWFHIHEHEQMLNQQKQQQPQQQGGQAGGQQQKVGETINFQNLPPDGQVQMAAQAGIKLDPNAMQQMAQQPQSAGQPSQPAGKMKSNNPMSAATPLKGAVKTNTLQPNNLKRS